MENLALYGGKKVKTTSFGTGKRFGDAELQYLKEALDQNTLFYYFGNKVNEMNKKFAKRYGVKHCVATSSGTAALHVALGACGVTAGDEVITSPITDMGSVIGILFQNAVPIFADLDPFTYNMDPKSIEEKITNKTKAIMVVHLTGAPADMDPIMEIAKKYNLKVVEDCAQAYDCYYKGRLVGTIGDAGCFSLNDFKHISAGDGGMVITNDYDIYEKSLIFADKNYQRLPAKGTMRSIPFLAPNYRMNELTGAVGLAQIDRLDFICGRRNEIGDRISKEIKDLPGLYIPKVLDNCKSSYWFYMFRINEQKAGVSRDLFSDALAAEGVPNTRGYIPTCVYNYDLFANLNAYDGTKCPFNCKQYYDKEIKYYKGMCPNAEEILDTAIRISISEFYTDQDVDDIIKAIRKVSNYFSSK